MKGKIRKQIVLAWSVASAWLLGSLPSFAMATAANGRGTQTNPTVSGDSTPSARTLARVTSALRTRTLEDDVSARIQSGLPIVRLPEISLAAAVTAGKFAARQLAALAPVQNGALTAEESLTLRLLRWQLTFDTEAPRYYWLSFGSVTPYSTVMREVARAFDAQRITDTVELSRYLTLLGHVAPLVDSMRAGLAARAARGIVLPKDEFPLVIALMRGYRRVPDSSAFIPTVDRLTGLEAGTASALRENAIRVVERDINPALDRLLTFLSGAYQKRAPTTVGLWQYPGGRAYYRYLVRLQTTMEITPAEVHRIGRREVARIDSAMAAIRAELGFTGTSLEFHAQLRSDPRFYAKTPDEVRQRLMSYVGRVSPAVSRFFSHTPARPAIRAAWIRDSSRG